MSGADAAGDGTRDDPDHVPYLSLSDLHVCISNPLIPPFFFPLETRTDAKVPVYVMLPLDLLVDNTVNDPSQLLAWFQQCAAAKVGGDGMGCYARRARPLTRVDYHTHPHAHCVSLRSMAS